MSLYDKPLTTDEVRKMTKEQRREALASITDGSMFYIYNALAARIRSMQGSVDDAQRTLDGERNEDHAIMYASLEGMIGHVTQMINESSLVEAQLKPFFYSS